MLNLLLVGEYKEERNGSVSSKKEAVCKNKLANIPWKKQHKILS